MPTLKQLACNVEWANAAVPFKEFGTTYGDGVVESYIAIPDSPTPFAIRLQSHGYIAPGLAMFVFIDGVYQCNRNRDNLRQTLDSGSNELEASEVIFRVRQKEEQLPDGTWIGKPWRFEPLQIVSEDAKKSSKGVKPDLNHLGTIHVFVLRCQGSGSDGNLTPDSGMEADFDLEKVGQEVSKLRLSALSPIHFNGPVFSSFDGPCDAFHQTFVPKRGLAKHHSHGHASERRPRREILKCHHHASHQSEIDDETSSDSQNYSYACPHCQDDETDTTSYSSTKVHSRTRAVSATERRTHANPRVEGKTTRARRHTHQSQEPRSNANNVCGTRAHSRQSRCESRGDDMKFLHGRRRHFSPIRDDTSSICTSSDEMVSRRPRSKKQGSGLSAAYKPSTTDRGLHHPNVQSTYRAPSEYIDQAGNRVVVPPIILHVNQAPQPQDPLKPIAKEKEEKKIRSASSGCYIVKNGKRILKNKGWSVTSSSEELSEGGNEAFGKPEHMLSTKVNSDGWIEEEPSDCVPQVRDTKNEQAWMSWIKGTGIQHDGNSASVKNLNTHPMPGANAHSSWNANNAHTAVATTSMAAAAQHANGQNAQSAVPATNAQPSLGTDSWTQPGHSDWNQDSGTNINTTTQVAGEWGDQSSSWNNIKNNDTSNWDQQQTTSSSGNDWNQAGAQINTAWNATETIGVQEQATSVGNNNLSDWSQPAAALQPNNAGEWTSNADNQVTNNTAQSESWDVNCPGKWTEGASNWGDFGAKATETIEPPAESQQTAVKETPEQPKDSRVREVKGKGPQNTRAGTVPLHPSCRTPGIILLNETPLYEVPASVAAGRALSHQVQPGQESSYVHRIKKPRYIDTLQQPYAKFVFHYRKADIIEKQFHVKLTPNAAEERMKLEKLPKTEILNRLLMAQGLLDEDTLLQSKTHAAHSSINEHNPKIPLPRNANAGIPSSAMSAVHFGPTETSNEQSSALFGTEPVSWHQPQSAGAQGFLQTVNSKLQAHAEDAEESQQGNDGWHVWDESAVSAW